MCLSSFLILGLPIFRIEHFSYTRIILNSLDKPNNSPTSKCFDQGHCVTRHFLILSNSTTWKKYLREPAFLELIYIWILDVVLDHFSYHVTQPTSDWPICLSLTMENNHPGCSLLIDANENKHWPVPTRCSYTLIRIQTSLEKKTMKTTQQQIQQHIPLSLLAKMHDIFCLAPTSFDFADIFLRAK